MATEINLEPNYKGTVRFFHAITDRKCWRKWLTADDNGWWAAVAAAHPNKAIRKMGKHSPKYNPAQNYAGVERKAA